MIFALRKNLPQSSPRKVYPHLYYDQLFILRLYAEFCRVPLLRRSRSSCNYDKRWIVLVIGLAENDSPHRAHSLASPKSESVCGVKRIISCLFFPNLRSTPGKDERCLTSFIWTKLFHPQALAIRTMSLSLHLQLPRITYLLKVYLIIFHRFKSIWNA